MQDHVKLSKKGCSYPHVLEQLTVKKAIWCHVGKINCRTAHKLPKFNAFPLYLMMELRMHPS